MVFTGRILDSQKRIAGVYLVGKGSISTCLVDTAEVFKAALVTNSPAFALVHNHPSGVTNPSPEDKSLANRIQEGAKLLSLEFTDFVIVGASSYFSFVEKGLMPNGTSR